MKKKVVFLVCLLISAALGDGFGKVSIATPAIDRSNTLSADIPTPPADLSGLVLTLQDLPAGFKEMPTAAMKKLTSDLASLKPASLFGYQKSDEEQFQSIIGFTMQIPDPIELAQFDAEIRKGNFAQEFSKSLNGGSPEDHFPNVTPLTLEDRIGEISGAWTSKGTIQGKPVNAEFAVFRRGKIVSFLMLMYLNGKKPAITMSSAARQLDKRIMELKPDLTQPQ
ncbi:hypothetical protein QUB68_25155 [Microcoleus sp. A006_D1]|uniref:hypothetical protein n=1 Tax=Microcoleus sp. A006_D1 TaxID=3055267 RepID=UPI002FD42052